MPVQIAHKHHDEIAEKGFTVIRNFLNAEEVAKYKEAAQAVIDYAREGNWSHVRTRGKQFPPWPENFSPDIWGVSGLLHPDLGEMSYPFHECYSSDKMINVACDILQVDRQSLSMELFNMLINPLTDFELDWHRDDIKPEATEEEEAEQLLRYPYAGTQFNLPLTEDKCLIVVPGSHKRIRTAEEREKTTDDSKKGFINGQIYVELHPGDIVFYDSNILHRAAYSSKCERITLHGSYGHVQYGKVRARGVLQHGVGEWLPRLSPRTENLAMMREKLIILAKEFEGVPLGFSLDG